MKNRRATDEFKDRMEAVEFACNKITKDNTENRKVLKSQGEKIDTISARQDTLIKNTAAVINAHHNAKVWLKVTTYGSMVLASFSSAYIVFAKIFKDL